VFVDLLAACVIGELGSGEPTRTEALAIILSLT
jgi:hypothetical protein